MEAISLYVSGVRRRRKEMAPARCGGTNLEAKERDGVGCLHGMAFIDREAVQPGGETIERCYTGIEQVYYLLENRGVLRSNGEEQEITEGDMIHIPWA